MKKQRNNIRFYAIDLLQLGKFIFHYLWVVILCGVVTSLIGFWVSTHFIASTYSSTIKFCVSSYSLSTDNTNFSITSAEIQAAQKLVKTYGEILCSRSTLEKVIKKSEVNCDWKELSGRIRYSLSNNTEIMNVKVISHDSIEAEKINVAIAEILPARISEVIAGVKTESIGCVSIETVRTGPSAMFYTVLGAFLGLFLSLTVFLVLGLFDNTVYDEEYVMRIYDYPVLGKVPNLINPSSKTYGYYKQKKGRIKSN